MMKRAMRMIVSVVPSEAHLNVERTQLKPANGSDKRLQLSEPESRSGPTIAVLHIERKRVEGKPRLPEHTHDTLRGWKLRSIERGE